MPTLLPVSAPVSAPVPSPSAPLSAPARWPAAWARLGFRARFGLVWGLIAGLVAVVPGFYGFVQGRPGAHLADPLLALLPAHDVSGPAFALIYGSSLATLAWLLPRPQLLLRGLWAYVLLQALRMAVLWLVPLEPPAGLLLLHDPFMDHVFGAAASARPIVRDLFFSGHTATLTLLALCVRGRAGRGALLLATVAVGLLVLVQRVHYTYDVLAAPPFAGLAYWLAGRVCRQQ